MVQITSTDPLAADSPRKIVAGSGGDSQAITEDALPQDDESALLIGPGGFDDSNLGPPSAASVPDAPPTQWQSESTQKKRQLALIGTISGCGLLIAVLVFSWFVRSWIKDKPPVAVNAVADVAPVAVVSPLSERLPEPETEPVDPESMEPPLSPDEMVTAGETDANPDMQLEGSPETTMNATAAMASTESPSSLPPPSLVEPWRVDGKAPVPESIAPIPRRDGDATTQAANSDDRGTLMELPPGLAEFVPLMNLAASNFDLQPTLKTPQTLNDIQLNAPAEELVDPMMIANPPEPIELDKALAIRMTFDSPGYMLTEFALFISQVTGVPIHLDWTSFDIAGQNIDQTISIPKGWKTAAELLDAISASIHAEARRENSLIVLTLSDEAFEAAQSPIVQLDDFGDGKDSALALLTEFLQLSGDGDGDGDGETKIPLASLVSREDKQLAAFAVESLRRMRGLEPKISDDRFQRWATLGKVSPAKVAPEIPIGHWPLLNGLKAIEQLSAPESMAGVLRTMGRTNDATCLINGYDFRRRGLSPKQLVMPYSGQSGEALLTKILTPFRMQVRQVDTSHWWVGTEATYDRLPILVWTEPLGEYRTGLVDRFNRLTENEIDGNFRLVIDTTSDRALMLLPRFIARQLDQLISVPGSP